MGCSVSRMNRAERTDVKDESFSFCKPSTTSAAATEVLREGSVRDQERTSAILQLSLSLSVLAAEHGRTETELCEATVAARQSISLADRVSIWRVRNRQGASAGVGDAGVDEGSSGHLVCLASDSMGMPGRSIALSEVGAPPCAALLASREADAPPLVVDMADVRARAELEERYGQRLRAALYVPILAPSTGPSEELAVNQLGVIELVLIERSMGSKDGTQAGRKAGEAASSTAAARDAVAPATRLAGARDPSKGTGGSPDGSFTNSDEAFTPTMRRQLSQLGGYLATALHSLRLSDEDLQGERLLYRMLPKHIVTQLQKRIPEDFIVESCDHAYVLFSDIVSFTAYCSRREPRDVVVMLNSMFATFDALLAKHRVHKVTTIGDAYVAATGLPFMESATPHLDIVNFALDMVAAVQTFMTEDGERMQIRIGVHAGPVAAGVVGIAMPRYCLFGETVTIAEQLEEKSRAGAILISHKVYDSLQNGTQGAISECLTYEESAEPLVLSGSSTPTTAFFVNARAHHRRQESLLHLEEMATAQLSYFKGRTTAESLAKHGAGGDAKRSRKVSKDDFTPPTEAGVTTAGYAATGPLQLRFPGRRTRSSRHNSDSDVMHGSADAATTSSTPRQSLPGLDSTQARSDGGEEPAIRGRRFSSPNVLSAPPAVPSDDCGTER